MPAKNSGSFPCLGARLRALRAFQVILAVARALWTVTLPLHAQKSSKKTSQDRGPYSFSDTIELLANGLNAETLIKKRSVNFKATPAMLEVLRQYGATDALLSMIPKASPPPAPVSGEVTLTCEPVDCDVIVGDRLLGSTKEKTLKLDSLAPGNTTFLVRAEGYEPQSQGYQLIEGTAREPAFHLKRTATERQHDATSALFQMMRLCGGVNGMATLWRGPLTGTIRLEGKEPIDWSFSLSSSEDGYALALKPSSGNVPCTVSFDAQHISPACKGRKRDESYLAAVTAASELFRDAMPPFVIDSLGSHLTTLTPVTPGTTIIDGDHASLAVDGNSQPVYASLKGPKGDYIATVTFEKFSTVSGGIHFPSKLKASRTGGQAIEVSFNAPAPSAADNK